MSLPLLLHPPLFSLHFDSCNDFSGLLAFQHHMINYKIISFCYLCLFESSKIATTVKADKWPRWMAVPLPGSGWVTDRARTTWWDVDMEVSAEHSPGAQSQSHKTIWNQLLKNTLLGSLRRKIRTNKNCSPFVFTKITYSIILKLSSLGSSPFCTGWWVYLPVSSTWHSVLFILIAGSWVDKQRTI